MIVVAWAAIVLGFSACVGLSLLANGWQTIVLAGIVVASLLVADWAFSRTRAGARR